MQLSCLPAFIGSWLNHSNFCFHDDIAFPFVLKSPSASLFWKYLWLHFMPTWKIQHTHSISRFLTSSLLQSPFAIEGNIDSFQWLWCGYFGGHYSDYHITQDAPSWVLPPPGPFLAHKKHSDSLSQYCRHAIVFSGELSLLCPIGYFSGHDVNIFYS